MLDDLLQTIARLIVSDVIGETLAHSITAGDDRITVARTDHLSDGDYILISDAHHSEAYERQIVVEPDNVIWLNEPVPVDLPEPTVQRTIDHAFIKSVYIGSPPALPTFPSITVSGRTSPQPLALGGTWQNVHDVTIAVCVAGDSYESTYQLQQHYANAIRLALESRISPDPCRYYFGEVTGFTPDEWIGTARCAVITYQCREEYNRFARDIQIQQILRDSAID